MHTPYLEILDLILGTLFSPKINPTPNIRPSVIIGEGCNISPTPKISPSKVNEKPVVCFVGRSYCMECSVSPLVTVPYYKILYLQLLLTRRRFPSFLLADICSPCLVSSPFSSPPRCCLWPLPLQCTERADISRDLSMEKSRSSERPGEL